MSSPNAWESANTACQSLRKGAGFPGRKWGLKGGREKTPCSAQGPSHRCKRAGWRQSRGANLLAGREGEALGKDGVYGGGASLSGGWEGPSQAPFFLRCPGRGIWDYTLQARACRFVAL